MNFEQDNCNIENDKSQHLEEFFKQINALEEHQTYKENTMFNVIEAIKKSNKIDDMRAYELENCGHFIEIDNKGKIKNANFCKNKLCPMCSWRKSLKAFSNNVKIFDFIRENFEKKFLFLTITTVNKKKLDESLDEINKGFKRFSNNRKFKKVVQGYIRQLEITYNQEKQTWHPHIHMILCVEKKYFESNDYIKHDEWLKMWRSAVRDENVTNLDIRRFSFGVDGNYDYKPIFEISKYLTKTASINGLNNDETVELLANLLDSTYHMRQGTKSGIFRAVAQNLDIEDEVTDLIDEDIENEKTIKLVWNGKKYVEFVPRS